MTQLTAYGGVVKMISMSFLELQMKLSKDSGRSCMTKTSRLSREPVLRRNMIVVRLQWLYTHRSNPRPDLAPTLGGGNLTLSPLQNTRQRLR